VKAVCSGNKSNLRIGLYRCPGCSSRVEMFSDESQVRCYNCDTVITREAMTPCIEWCASSCDCAGRPVEVNKRR
jgi:hypothetical protein